MSETTQLQSSILLFYASPFSVLPKPFRKGEKQYISGVSLAEEIMDKEIGHTDI